MKQIPKMRRTVSFVLLAFVLSYGLGFTAQWAIVVHGWGGSNPVIDFMPNFLVVLGPAVAAMIVVRLSGESISDWFASDLRSTHPAWWWLGIPPFALVVSTAGFWLAGVPGSELAEGLANLPVLAGYYALHIFVVGALEEIGWRGWLLRERLTGSSPIFATLTVAAIWGLWHLPKLLTSLPAAAAFAVAVIVNSFLLTAVWSRFRGRTALAAVTHGSFNAPIYFFTAQLTGADAPAAFAYTVGVYAVVALIMIAFTWMWWVTRAPVDHS